MSASRHCLIWFFLFHLLSLVAHGAYFHIVRRQIQSNDAVFLACLRQPHLKYCSSDKSNFETSAAASDSAALEERHVLSNENYQNFAQLHLLLQAQPALSQEEREHTQLDKSYLTPSRSRDQWTPDEQNSAPQLNLQSAQNKYLPHTLPFIKAHPIRPPPSDPTAPRDPFWDSTEI
uniref:Uncharacterized protein n=1 Tax=Plectus sambesii TaxID=2011161 RepID=A0A914UK10_9BILA